MSRIFEKDDAAAWKARIVKELKGADPEKLYTRNRDGQMIAPFYTSDTHVRPEFTGRTSDWAIKEEFGADEDFNPLLTEALEAGVPCLAFSSENLAHLSSDILVQHLEIELEGQAAHQDWLGFLEHRGLTIEQLRGGYRLDPLAQALISRDNPEQRLTELHKILADVQGAPHWDIIHIQADAFHNAGATPMQELSYALSLVKAYLDEDYGLASRMVVTLAASSDYFDTVSKLRAWRILWANLMKTYDLNQAPKVHARASALEAADIDPDLNLLRASSQAMAAIVAGAERISLPPSPGRETSFAHRMSRNVLHLLQHESYLDKVDDPVRGAYLFEDLTQRVAVQAWDAFKGVQNQGGVRHNQVQETMRQELTKSAEQWVVAINSGEKTWLGVNLYNQEEGEWPGLELRNNENGWPIISSKKN